MSDDVRFQMDKTMATIRTIVEVFPKEQWLKIQGPDSYYIPCRIAYHLAVVIDRMVAGGFKDPDFTAKLPYGAWMEATAETLPNQEDLLVYLDATIARAKQELTAMDDATLASPIEEARGWMGASQLGAILYALRELSDHTGELNKMLLDNGVSDIWIAR